MSENVRTLGISVVYCRLLFTVRREYMSNLERRYGAVFKNLGLPREIFGKRTRVPTFEGFYPTFYSNEKAVSRLTDYIGDGRALERVRYVKDPTDFDKMTKYILDGIAGAWITPICLDYAERTNLVDVPPTAYFRMGDVAEGEFPGAWHNGVLFMVGESSGGQIYPTSSNEGNQVYLELKKILASNNR